MNEDDIKDQMLTTLNRLIGTAQVDLRETAQYAVARARHLQLSRDAVDFNEMLKDEANNVKLFGANKLVEVAEEADGVLVGVITTALDWASRILTPEVKV